MIPSLSQLVAVMAGDYLEPADLEADGLHMRFLTIGDAFVVSCRGSADLQDWFDNLDVLDCEPRNHPKLGRLCAGFADDVIGNYDSIRAELAGQLAPTIIGHSRGGAQAQELAGLLRADGLPVASVVTCGAPRVCGAHGLPELLADVPGVDLWNGNDPVPYVPLQFRRPRPQSVQRIGPRQGLALRFEDHHIAAYQASVDALANAA